jgi:hypothetical protein
MKQLSKQEMVNKMTTHINSTYNLLNKIVDETNPESIRALYDKYINDTEEEEEEMWSGYLPTNLEVQLVSLGDVWAVDVRERAKHEDDADPCLDGYLFHSYKEARALYEKAVAYHEHHPVTTMGEL